MKRAGWITADRKSARDSHAQLPQLPKRRWETEFVSFFEDHRIFGRRFSWISTVFLQVVVENVDLYVYPCFCWYIKMLENYNIFPQVRSIQTSNSASLKLKEVQVSPCRAPWVRCHGGNSLAMYIMYHNVCWWCCQSMTVSRNVKKKVTTLGCWLKNILHTYIYNMQ